GNTRGAVLMSNKIFAGLETPTAYNTVGGATGEEDNWNLTKTYDAINLPVEAWVQVEADDVPARVEEATGKNYPNVYAYKQTNVELKKNQKVEVMLQYKTGSHRLNLGGADLLDSKGAIVASDYHSGFTGANHQNNTYTFYVPNDGLFSVRVFVEDKTETITATSEMITKVYTAKEGVVVNSDVVGIQGRWSRNTTLEKGETWKVAAVVGLVAQDGTEALENIHKTQKRRSFLAYSERERAVPWRAMPMYLTWYELQINRNNAEPGREHLDNTKAEDVMDVLSHWKSDMYDRYGIAPKVFIIDDGWDKYGEWKFHSSFPNEMRDMSKAANEMDNAGIGAWLGPVGGYGNSGNHRRNYWKDKGQMQLSNPAYYKAFKDAAYNLVKNQGDNYVFFKFDGISGQFSSVGPDNGDTGNENAEGIIRLERFVREQLREDIFFNTSVGTWASPFWYQITDATWRQENDWGELGYNKLRRERWITYRDNLVHQNYVTNSPICPINTLMTHGFILTKFGPPAGDERTYDVVRRELRCAFLCGSGMVELYNDYDLMNSINNGKLWADLAECIAWQKRNADVLPDIHWVGGDPEDGSKENIYGWASWNGTKSTLALRNGGNDAKSYTFTLREALNIPANVNGSIVLRSSFSEQDALSGLTEGEPIGIDSKLTVTLAGSSVYSFDGLSSTATIQEVGSIALTTENGENKLPLNKTLVLRADVAPAEATYPVLTWTSSNPEVATVSDGLVVPVKEGETTITVTAKDGSGVSKSIKITVTPKVLEPYATNFDKNANPVNTDRYITNIVFAEEGAATQTVEVGVKKPYIDFSADADRLLTCTPGANVTAQINKSGNWMNGYVYIDLDGDQQFSFREGSTDQTGTEVMSFSFYNGVFGTNDAGVNSAGDALSGNARNTMTLPPFKAPAEEGDYRIRFKMDWNSIDAGGQIAADGTCTGENGILANRGSIVDLTLRVAMPTGIERVEADTNVENEYYDLSGRKLNTQPEKGVFIKNHQKVIR
ncbi:MAG: Ig-like domain-containing protein, partial [Paraprevotella sp.]|nr:Ig-like domain-containing protein [Paraprevotella sp.]